MRLIGIVVVSFLAVAVAAAVPVAAAGVTTR